MMNVLQPPKTAFGAQPYKDELSLAATGPYHNNLEPFLGPPTKAIDHNPSDQFPHEAWFLPDAYTGRNDYVRETIVQTVVNYNSFMTTEVLPWREQNNPNIAWDSIKFDKTLIDMEPEQGIPRYVTVEREAHSDFMVRRGLALMVNHGFAATPGGQKDFMYKVATIAGAVQETCDQSGVMALLRCKNMYSGHVTDMVRDAHSAYDMFQHELWKWGIIQHSERGWYHMDAEAESILQTGNIEPDTWIVPSRMRSYAAMGQHAETEVYRAGEKTARGNLELGKKNFSTFRGKKVYEVRPYQLDVDGRVIDPLNRTRMIGDFFVVPYFAMNDANTLECRAGETQVYCCQTDRFEKFSWKQLEKEIDLRVYEEYGIGEYFQWPEAPTQYSDDCQRLSLDTSDLIDPKLNAKLQSKVNEATAAVDTRLTLAMTQLNARTAEIDAENLKAEVDTLRTALGLINTVSARTSADTKRQLEALETLVNELTSDDGAGRVDMLKAAVDELGQTIIAIEARLVVQEQNDPNDEDLAATGAAGGGPGGPGENGSRFNSRTRLALDHALRRAIRVEYQVDPSCAQAARSTWAIVRDRDPALAASRSLRLYAAAFEDTILGLSGETLAELNDAMHFDEHGAQYPVDQVANDLYDAYLDPVASNGGWTALRRKASAAHDAQCAQQATITKTRLLDRAHNAVRAMPDVAATWSVKSNFSAAMRRFVLMFLSVPFKRDTTTYETYYGNVEQRDALIEAFSEIAVGLFTGPTRADSAGRQDVADIQSLWYMLLGDKTIEFCPLLVLLWTVRSAYEYTHAHDEDLAYAPSIRFHEEVFQEYQRNPVVNTSRAIFVTWETLCKQLQFDEPTLLLKNIMYPVFQAMREVVYQGEFFFVHDVYGMGLATDTSPDAWKRRFWNDQHDYTAAASVQHQNVQNNCSGDPVFDILCVRPFREYTMGTGMLLKKGSELGNTFRGWADFQLTDNIIAKTHIGHFTFWHASIVTNPKCLFLAEDIFCTNYLRGEGKTLLKSDLRKEFMDDPMGVMQREDADIICLPIPIGSMDASSHRLNMNNPVSLNNSLAEHTGKFGTSMRGVNISMISSQYPSYLDAGSVVGRSAAQVQLLAAMFGRLHEDDRQYKAVVGKMNNALMKGWAFDKLNNIVDIESANTFETNGNLINTICFHTMQKFRNPKNNRWEVTNLNTGHFGENGIYEGVKKIRCGFIDYFKEMDYQKSMAMGGMCI